MGDERAREIERLQRELSETTARRDALRSEMLDLTASIHDIRKAFGNPFFYSHPEHDDESAANYTGFSSHDVFLPTAMAIKRVDRELARIREWLRALGIATEQP